ncbi:MAG TPA: type IV secretion system protein, partial [Candidatus Megaira endosymbiont of Hartmannula sinica]|nr:type IV secretion system protein [Candidatus Megaera endosymbiont of Hartmannula sinica]
MGGGRTGFILIIALIGLAVAIIYNILMLMGFVNSDYCIKRYSDQPVNSQIYSLSLHANGNYSIINENGIEKVNPNTYGFWKNSGINIRDIKKLYVEARGEISLCKAYLPKNNLYQTSDKNKQQQEISIPRLEDNVDPLFLPLNSSNNLWRNLTKVNHQDKLVVFLKKDQGNQKQIIINNIFDKNRPFIGDCSDKKINGKYSPICGRFSPYIGRYANKCTAINSKCTNINQDTYQEVITRCENGYNDNSNGKYCTRPKFGGVSNYPCCKKALGLCTTCDPYKKTYQTKACYDNNSISYSSAPSPYIYGDNNLIYSNQDITSYPEYLPQTCLYYQDRELVEKFKDNKFWFSADNAAGLIYRFSSSQDNKQSRGSNYTQTKILDIDHRKYFDSSKNKNVIFFSDNIDNASITDNSGYLQFRYFPDNNNVNKNIEGGYVIGIKHTKCIAKSSTPYQDKDGTRGVVQYTILPEGENPNDSQSKTIDVNILTINDNNKGIIEFNEKDNKGGILWLKISNKDKDYKDSTGNYNIDIITEKDIYGFYESVMKPLLEDFKKITKDTINNILSNITCTKSTDKKCTDFFNYIKIVLVLYVIIMGILFGLSIVKMTNQNFIMMIVKIIIISSLLNGELFYYFSNDLIDSLIGFSDEIISNMGEYNITGTQTSSNNISNPFMFLNAIFDKIFFTDIFKAQMSSLLAFGISGIIYFVIIFTCIVIFLIVAIRSILVYLMSFLAIAVLISLTPIFLIFILFDSTKYLFDNWIRFTFRYLIEPVIVLIGVIIIAQLFMVYLDKVLSFSVCVKCAIPFEIPFIEKTIGSFIKIFNQPIFCIKWFAPWGIDITQDNMGFNVFDMFILFIISYNALGYIDMASKITSRLAVNSGGGGGAGAAASSMYGTLSNKALKRIGLDRRSRARHAASFKKRMRSMMIKSNRTDPYKKDKKKEVSKSTTKNIDNNRDNKIDDKLETNEKKPDDKNNNINNDDDGNNAEANTNRDNKIDDKL